MMQSGSGMLEAAAAEADARRDREGRKMTVEPACLIIHEDIPDKLPGVLNDGGEAFRAAWREFYDEQARRFVGALLAHAPGGLVDAVLVELLRQKASIFRVRL